MTGFADDEWAGVEQLRAAGFPLVCDFAGLPMFLRRNVVDEVVIALPIRSFHEHASRIADMCEQQGIIVRPLPGDVLAMSPPFVISSEQIDRIVMVLDKAITHVEKELKASV